MAITILHSFKESVEYNLEEVLPSLSTRVVTGSAFSQRRYQVSSKFFKALSMLPYGYYQNMDKRTWNGHLLLAGDGSTLNLPISKQVREDFGVHSTTSHGVDRCLSRIFFVYDVLNSFVVDAQFSHMDDGEKTLLNNSLQSLKGQQGLFLLDRNFGYFSSLKQLTTHGQHFCIRLSVDASHFTKRVMANDGKDFIIDWKPSRTEYQTCKKHLLDTLPIKVRVVKVVLESGETELLVTSLLDQQKYPAQQMKELYHLRWGVEECFKNLKPKMKIEYFGCKKTEGILQEFHAHIFMLNMIGLVAREAQKEIETQCVKRKRSYQYNWKNAFRYLRKSLTALLSQTENIGQIIGLLIEQVARSKIAIIPNRTFSRGNRPSKKTKQITQYNK